MNVSRRIVAGLLASGFALAAGAARGGEEARPVQAETLVLAAAHSSLSGMGTPEKMLAASKYMRTATCLPAGGVSQADVLVAAATYLRENPQQQGLPPGALLSNALQRAYPCPR